MSQLTKTLSANQHVPLKISSQKFINMKIPVVDLFCGIGSFSDGFCSGAPNTFFKALGADRDADAVNTARIRVFQNSLTPEDRCNWLYPNIDRRTQRIDLKNLTKNPVAETLFREASQKILNIELGSRVGNDSLDRKIIELGLRKREWVLLGGPPCQAYSVAGRAKNLNKAGYKPHEDSRHYLYREYLRVIRDNGPAAFVMENVKGVESARLGETRILDLIMSDLSKLKCSSTKKGYDLFSLTESGIRSCNGSFLVNSKDFGVAQSRERVFIIGIRSDLSQTLRHGQVMAPIDRPSCRSALSGLPEIRSELSNRGAWKGQTWVEAVKKQTLELAENLGPDLADITEWIRMCDPALKGGTLPNVSFENPIYMKTGSAEQLHLWIRKRDDGPLFNHYSKKHMPSDLGRYAFVSAWRNKREKRLTTRDLPPTLRPEHKNFERQVFVDRFRAIPPDEVSPTITGHIGMDGHAFIHWDTTYCRSISMREAARLQSIPDDYLISGPSRQQGIQIGNAVPHRLASFLGECLSLLF